MSDPPKGTILALAGGVGGAKLVVGLAKTMDPTDLMVIVNTGDDEQFHGLHVSPDIDTMMYTLAGISDSSTGWGIAGDSFRALDMLHIYGADNWFNLGDKDLATHIRRTDLLGKGLHLSEITSQMCRQLGIECAVVPMSDQRIQTILDTEDGPLPMQEYFVRRRCEPKVSGISFKGTDEAEPSPAFKSALSNSSGLIICPSNPFLSIGPILAIPSVRESIASFQGIRVIVSPIVDGKALRGPAGKLLKELNFPVSSVGVAQQYRGLCDFFVLDHQDAHLSDSIRDLGIRPSVTSTVMETESDKERLAQFVVNLIR